ncbi:OLC1v1037404C1 [Oldenlandia corymbosa var. corymbosa]|uniref:OLC1v1037404C1 n=1 Tax=Oldenlandia corymbosa var. corymbosa TaxID=529605 RepID=A0AAV1D1D0_OLDCO|nr:OLC1v1037404C1 [Oldenlandia corymbosa var. corymbosa]
MDTEEPCLMEHDADNPATKKVRNRDDPNQISPRISPESISEESGEIQSFKNSLLQGQQPQKSKGFHLEEVTTEPGEVTHTVENGMPAIKFADTVKPRMERAMSYSIVVIPLGRNFSFLAIRKPCMNLWNPKGDIHLVDSIDGYHIIRLTHKEDYYNALLNGPWTIVDHYITVLLYKLNFDTKAENISTVAAWVRIPGLPVHYFHGALLRDIAKPLGSYLKADNNPLLAERGRYARIVVELDLTKPLVGKVKVDHRIFTVEYEDLRRTFFKCGKYGHTIEECPEAPATPPEEDPQSTVVSMVPNPIGQNGVQRESRSALMIDSNGDKTAESPKQTKPNLNLGEWSYAPKGGRRPVNPAQP